VTIPEPLLARVDALFGERVERGVAPSSVWGVFDADGLVASGGHGDRGDGLAPDAETVYRIASCTKSVTAASLLLLVERGLVDLETPITEFVPAFAAVRLPTEDSPDPTPRMLLTMSAGFPTDDPWADRQESITDDDLDAVLRRGILFDSVPGTRFAYSNLGYALLGRVVSVVSGDRYTEFAAHEVLEPLGLTTTRFAAPHDRGYVVTGTRPFAGAWEPLPLSGPGAFSGIGGLFSTVRELSTWARHLSAAFRGTRSGGTPSPAGPVTSQHRRLMQQAARVIPGRGPRPTGYGLGLFVEHDPRVGTIASHSGGYPGFSAHMRWSVETGVGVVAFENATAARVPLAAEAAHDLLLDGLPTPDRTGAALPETRRARRAVSSLLTEWSDPVADATFTPNVAEDVPYDRRRAAIAEAFSAVGADPRTTPEREWSDAPTHLAWTVRGERGAVRVEFRLAPLAAGLVQSLVVVAVPDA
jgi:CubicO group peptidase (beta-lactamase class C family)